MNRSAFYKLAVLAMALHGIASAAGQPAQPPATQPAPTDGSCAQLPASEAAFASQFTDMGLKKTFCSQLTPSQRQQVMAMTKEPDASGMLMTADQAMQKFMQSNPPAPAATTPQRPSSSGGCPVD